MMSKQCNIVESASNERLYTPGDEDQIFELVNAVWESKLEIPTKNYWIKGWQWMYACNPSGKPIIWLAEKKGKLVGVYPLVMVDMKIGESLGKAGQIVDTMTHPQYQRQGIAFSLGSKSLRKLGEQKALLAFGFPNAESYPLHMISGWIDVCAIQSMTKPLNLKNILIKYFNLNDNVANLLSKLLELPLRGIFPATNSPTIDGLTISKISSFDDRFNEFWERISIDYNIIVQRNKNYLSWRYIDTPNSIYTIYMAEVDKTIFGYMVLEEKEQNGLLIGQILDITAPKDQNVIVRCLISTAVKHFEQTKVDVISSRLVCNRYRDCFLKSGFIPYPRSKSRFIAYKASPAISDEYLKDPNNWFIQLGDLMLVF